MSRTIGNLSRSSTKLLENSPLSGNTDNISVYIVTISKTIGSNSYLLGDLPSTKVQVFKYCQTLQSSYFFIVNIPPLPNLIVFFRLILLLLIVKLQVVISNILVLLCSSYYCELLLFLSNSSKYFYLSSWLSSHYHSLVISVLFSQIKIYSSSI